ncbi:MAG TPA: hypothetical protein PLA49_13605 [Propioniciclava sp.]|uniref:hypothetical protein n=1 Tax=Propioniciclava sp. TaxID=2038686 RepID=UPI002B9A1EA9|nr:hypothetical protein [Propioniciclava sp.]HRL50397.1 hypothetical protein [Propioniciclava sp.]
MTEQQHEQERRDEDAVTPPVADAEAPHGEVNASATPHDPTLTQGEKFTPEKLGDAAIKFATETVYAAAGLANVVAEKAKEFYDSQRKQIAENTPEGVDPNFRQFVDSMPDQFKTFMDDATKAFHDLSERGRTTMGDFQEQVQTAWKQWEDQQRDQRAAADEMTGAFDLKDAAEATSDAESAVAPEEPVTSQAPAAGFDAPAEVGEVPVEEYPGEGKGDVRND